MRREKLNEYWNDYDGVEPLPEDRGYVPYELFDDVFPYIDNLAELKVVLYIVRRTTTFKKAEDWIAKCQFENGMESQGEKLNPGAGLSRTSIDKGIKLAIEHGIIEERIECGRCKQELIREEKWRIRRKECIRHHRAPKSCPNCHISTQTKMRYKYRLVYKDEP